MTPAGDPAGEAAGWTLASVCWFSSTPHPPSRPCGVAQRGPDPSVLSPSVRRSGLQASHVTLSLLSIFSWRTGAKGQALPTGVHLASYGELKRTFPRAFNAPHAALSTLHTLTQSLVNSRPSSGQGSCGSRLPGVCWTGVTPCPGPLLSGDKTVC